MNRRIANMRIASLLERYFERYPDARFGQALVNLGIVQIGLRREGTFARLTKSVKDPFHEEPEETLMRAEEAFRVLVP